MFGEPRASGGTVGREPDDLKTRTFTVMIVLLLAATAGLQLLVYRDGFYAISQDDGYRTLDAYLWLHDPAASSEVWLPGHRMLVGAALRVWPDLVVTPRAVSGTLGVLCVLLVVWIAREIFPSRRVALVAGVLTAVYPARLVLSAVPLAEILFIFTVLAAIGFMSAWLVTGRQRSFLVAALFFSAGTAVRYEGWVFAGSFILLAAWRALRSRDGTTLGVASLLAAAAIVASFPGYWIASHMSDPRGVLGFLTASGDQYAAFNSTSAAALLRNNPATQFITLNAASMNLLGVIPFAAAVRSDPRIRAWAIVPGLSLFLVSAAALVGWALPSHTFWRIPAVWGFLLVPFTARFVAEGVPGLLGRVGKRRILLFLLVFVPSVIQCVEMTRRSAMTPGDVALGRRLDGLLETRGGEGQCKVLLESTTPDYVHIVVASQHPSSVVFTSPIGSGEVRVPILDPHGPLGEADLAARSISYLVLRSESMIARLSRPGWMRELGRYGPWTLFEFAGSESGRDTGDGEE